MVKDDVSVRVALRIRPMLSHETSIGCQPCISEVTMLTYVSQVKH